MKKSILPLLLCVSIGATSAHAATNLVFDMRGNIIGSYVEGNAASYNKMQASLSGLYYKKAGDLGYTPVSQTGGGASWSPKVTSTIDAVSGVAGTTAGAVTGALLAGATAPGWVGVAMVAGISAVVGYAVNLGISSLARWLFRSDNQIDESGEPSPVTTTTAINAGGGYWKTSFHSTGVDFDFAGGDGEAVARQGYYEYRSQTKQSTTTAPTCSVGNTSVTCSPIMATYVSSGAPASCMAGTVYNYATKACGAYSFPLPSSVPSKTASLQTAIADIPASDKTKPLNPAIVAAIANKLWATAASQPGYQGVPFSYANPITEKDVQDWQAANPTQYPSVQDFVTPMTSGSTTGSPWSLPVSGQPVGTTNGSQTAPTGTTNPASSQPLTNLGPDPGIASPSLEAPPTAQQILSPILGLFPDLRSFTMPGHAAVCPAPSLDLWGKHLVLDGHCTLLDNNRGTIQAVMAVVWVALALFIILAA
jgi:hypothetical protein